MISATSRLAPVGTVDELDVDLAQVVVGVVAGRVLVEGAVGLAGADHAQHRRGQLGDVDRLDVGDDLRAGVAPGLDVDRSGSTPEEGTTATGMVTAGTLELLGVSVIRPNSIWPAVAPVDVCGHVIPMVSPGDTVAGVSVRSSASPGSATEEAVHVTASGTGTAGLIGTVASRSHEQVTRHWESANEGRFRLFGSPPSSGLAAR